MKKIYNSTYNEENIKNMFNKISKKYDIINFFLSFGLDYLWRQQSVNLLKMKIIKHKNIYKILDLATGTGNLAIALAKKFKNSYVIGIDYSDKMIEIAKKKISLKLKKRIKFIVGNSINIPFDNETFDIVTISFGIRNFTDIDNSIKEIYRVLKPYGIIDILEFSRPSNLFIRKIYYLYNYLITYKIGGLLSNNYYAYNYLQKSIKLFRYNGLYMKKLLEYHKFINIYIKQLTFGIVSIYLFNKNNIKNN